MSGNEEKDSEGKSGGVTDAAAMTLGAVFLAVLAVCAAPFVFLYVMWRWWVETVWKGNDYP